MGSVSGFSQTPQGLLDRFPLSQFAITILAIAALAPG
jgi:hypothetical protein